MLFLAASVRWRSLLLPMHFSSRTVLPHEVELLSVDSASVKIGSRNQMFLKTEKSAVLALHLPGHAAPAMGREHARWPGAAAAAEPLCPKGAAGAGARGGSPRTAGPAESGSFLLTQGEGPQETWEKHSSQCFKFLSCFAFMVYNCISVPPPTAATLGLEKTVSLLLREDPAPST